MLLSADDPRVVLPDSELGLKYGFNSNDFDGYLWLESKDIILIPFIASWNQHQGNFRRLLDNLRKDFHIAVMHPCDHMRIVCYKYGMQYDEKADVAIIRKIETV